MLQCLLILNNRRFITTRIIFPVQKNIFSFFFFFENAIFFFINFILSENIITLR